MTKIRIIKAHDRGKIYELIQRDDQYRPGEIEQILHLIDTFLFESDQKLYTVIIAENDHREILGFAVYGPDPASVGTFIVYKIMRFSSAHQEKIVPALLEYIEQEVKKNNGRIIVVEISSDVRWEPHYLILQKNNYKLSSRILDFYNKNEDKLVLSKIISNRQREAQLNH